MPLTVAYHGPSTIFCVRRSVLAWHYARLQSLTDGRRLAAN